MLESTHFEVLQETKRALPLHRFFIGYWILKRGWIFILALFFCYKLQAICSFLKGAAVSLQRSHC